MNTKKSISKFLFGWIMLVAFMPLAFTVSQSGTQLLLETDYKYVVWGVQATTLILVLSTRLSLSKNQLIGLSVLCVFVPLAFSFNENGTSFLILNKYTSSILSWAIAGVLIGKIFFVQKLKENTNL